MPDATTPTPTAAATPPAPAAPAAAPASPSLATPEGRREAAMAAFAKAAGEAEAAAPAPAATPEAPKPDAPTEKPPEVAKPAEPPMSAQLAKLVDRERKTLAREAELKAREAKLAQLEEARSKGDVEAVLQANGLSLQQVQDFYLNGKQPTVEDKQAQLAREVEALKKAREEESQRLAQSQKQAQVEHARNTYKDAFKKAAAEAGEKFELAAAYGDEAASKAVDVFEAYYAQHGMVPALPDVLAAVDSYYETASAPLLTSKRIKAKLGFAAQPSTAQPPTSPSGPNQPPRTLTNSLAAAAPGKPTPAKSREALRDEAIAGLSRLMRGE